MGQSCERENRLVAARESRRREELENRVQEQHVELDRRYKDRCREVEIDRKNKEWEKKENMRLMYMQQEAKASIAMSENKRHDEKLKCCMDMQNAAADRAAKAKRNAEINAKREENIKKREAERQKKAADQALQLKNDAVAKSKAVVILYTERTISGDTTPTSMLTQTPISGPRGQLGPTPGSII